MAKSRGSVIIDKERCKGCGICVATCPEKVLNLNEEVNFRGYNYSFMENPDQCTGCTSCAMVCPDGVISVFRQKPVKA